MPDKGDWVQNVHTGRKAKIISKYARGPIVFYELDTDTVETEDDKDIWSEDALLHHWHVIPPVHH